MGKNRQSLAANRQFMTIIEESRRSYQARGAISMEEACRALRLKLTKRIGKAARKKN